MAHFAKIENNKVIAVYVVDNEHENTGAEYLNALGILGEFVQTSYNANFGKKFAGIGDSYDKTTGFFKPVKPYPSWKFDENTWSWVAPKPYPIDEKFYNWDENLKEWVTV